MQLVYLLSSLVAGVWCSSNTPVSECSGSCSTENIALVQRQASRLHGEPDGEPDEDIADRNRHVTEDPKELVEHGEPDEDISDRNRHVEEDPKELVEISANSSKCATGNSATAKADEKFGCKHSSFGHCSNDYIQSCPSGKAYYCGVNCQPCTEHCTPAAPPPVTCEPIPGQSEASHKADAKFGCRRKIFGHCSTDHSQSCPSGQAYYCGVNCQACDEHCSPTPAPTANPTAYPTAHPTAYPTAYPTAHPTAYPTAHPTAYPTANPTAYPTANPTTPSPTAPIYGAWTVTRKHVRSGRTKTEKGVCGLSTDVFSIENRASKWCQQKRGTEGQALVNQDGVERSWAFYCSDQGATEIVGTPTFVAEAADGPCANQHNAVDDGKI